MADANNKVRILPVLQLSGGVSLLALGTAAIALSCKWSYFAAPILASTMIFLPTGALGIYILSRSNTVLLARYRVLSRLASLVSVVLFAFYCSAAALEEATTCMPGLKRSAYSCGKLGARQAVDGLITVTASFEIAVCLLTSFDLRGTTCFVQSTSSTKTLSMTDLGEPTSIPREPNESAEGPTEAGKANNYHLTENGKAPDEEMGERLKEGVAEFEHLPAQVLEDGRTSSDDEQSPTEQDSDRQGGTSPKEEIIAEVHPTKIRSHGKLVPQDSFLTDSEEESDEEGADMASKMIRPSRGGYIRLPHYGISLFIPVWALQEDCRITLKVLPQPSSFLFAEDEAVISPGVVCEPSGTRFKTPLRLTLPHCAVLTDLPKARVTMHFTHGSNKVSKEELSSEGTPRCVVREDVLEVYIDHFSICEIFMVISDYFLGKRVASTPYLPKSMSRLQPQYCHLRLFNDTPGLEDLIEAEEDKLDYRKMAPTQKMFILWEKGELKIQCDVESGHVTEKEKTVSLDDIYRLDRNVLNFLVRALGDAEVFLKFHFYPHCDEGHAFKAKFSNTDGTIAADLQQLSTTSRPTVEAEASMSLQETSTPSKSQNATKASSEPQTFSARLDDKLLFDIAEEIETDDQLERLMQTLEVSPASRLRCHEQNRLEGRLTARGTRQMLLNWRAETAVGEQRDRLKNALTGARLLDLRDRFLPAVNS